VNTLESKNINLLIDFDSTIIKDESLELLSEISVKNSADKIKIANITRDAMEGKIGFSNALRERVALLKSTKQQLKDVIVIIEKRLTDSFIENKDFFRCNSANCYIVSGGFIEIIHPVLEPFNILKSNIFANEFLYDKNNNIISVNHDNPLSKDKGKVKVAKNIIGQNIIIGDGYTDYEVKQFGHAKKFIQFSENINRPILNSLSDYTAYNFNDVINYIENNF